MAKKPEPSFADRIAAMAPVKAHPGPVSWFDMPGEAQDQIREFKRDFRAGRYPAEWDLAAIYNEAKGDFPLMPSRQSFLRWLRAD